MTEMLPIVEILAGCTDDAGRADWLLTVPDSVVMRDQSSIRLLLRQAGFLVGVECFDVRFASLHATRGPDGDLPSHTLGILDIARSVLRGIVRENTQDVRDRQ